MRALDSVWTRIRLRTSVHRYAMHVLDELGHAPLMDPLTRIGPRTTAIGLDPIRLLVFGGGLAVGYGVTCRADAFDGPLVARLAADTDRGITLENRAVQHIHVEAAVASLGLAGAHTFHLAIWSPSFAEALQRISLRAWRTGLTRMVTDLHADTTIPVILMHLPEPSGRHPTALLGRPWAQRINRVIDEVAARYPHATSVPMEPFTVRDFGQLVIEPNYFTAISDRLTPAVLAALNIPARQDAPAPTAST